MVQSPSAAILEPPRNKVFHCFHCFPISLPQSNETGCCDLSILHCTTRCLISWLSFITSTLSTYLSCLFPNLPIKIVLFAMLYATTVEPDSRAQWPQLLRPACPRALFHNKRSPHKEKPTHCNWRVAPTRHD